MARRKQTLPPADSYIYTAGQQRASSVKLLGEAATLLYSCAAGRLLQQRLLTNPNTCRRLASHCFPDGRVEIEIDGLIFTWPDAENGCEWLRRLARFAALLLAPPRAEYADYAWSLFAEADALAPEVAHESKLALAGLGFLLGWPQVRQAQQAALQQLRIRTR